MSPDTLTPDVVEVISRVQADLEEQLDLLERHGGNYVRECVVASLQPRRLNPPRKPAGMDTHIGRFVRERIADELAVRRQLPVRWR